MLKIVIQTMSSLEIAELTGKEHKHIKRDLRKLYNKLGDMPKLDYTRNGQNQTVGIFKVPHRECNLLLMGYDIIFSAKVYDRWQELEQQTPKTVVSCPSEALGSQTNYLRKIKKQEATLKKHEKMILAIEKYLNIVNHTKHAPHEAPKGFIPIKEAYKKYHINISVTAFVLIIKAYKVDKKEFELGKVKRIFYKETNIRNLMGLINRNKVPATKGGKRHTSVSVPGITFVVNEGLYPR